MGLAVKDGSIQDTCFVLRYISVFFQRIENRKFPEKLIFLFLHFFHVAQYQICFCF